MMTLARLKVSAALACGLAGTLAAGGVATALPVSTSFSLSGNVNTTGAFNQASLESFPATNQTVSYKSGSGTTTGTFTGVPLYTFLTDPRGGGGIQTQPGVKNDYLRDFVVAKGSDGYRAVVSVGEIHPNFGNQQNLLAYQFNGQPLGDNGFARTTAPGDISGGRYVSNLSSLEVHSSTPMSQIVGTGGGISNQFSLSGQIAAPGNYTLATLQTLPSVTESVTYQAGQNTVNATFTGVTLWNLLNAAGLIINPNVKNDLLGQYVVATGSDGYKAVIAMGEIAPQFGNQQDLVAYDSNGQGLGADGFARLVLPGDKFGGRYVSNLVGLEVFSAPVPIPAAIWLFGSGFAALAGFARRKSSGI